MLDEAPSNALRADTGLLSLVLIMRFFNLAADPDQIRHEAGTGGNPLTLPELLRSARRAGLLVRQTKITWSALSRTPLPAVARLRDGSFVIFARRFNDATVEKLLVHNPLSAAPEMKTEAEIASCWDGDLVLVSHRDALAGPKRRFDLSWFIPVIVRYRKLLGEVLITSFFIQLMGLISPIFFQVITDKVLVHRGMSSLTVLVIGLALVSLFEVILTTVRTYVFSHTTSRIDVHLGSQLFRHLMKLPLSFFASRQTGSTVASVKEMENIRNFLTGSALTLAIDAVFTVVFFCFMFLYSPTLTWIVLATIPLYVGLSLLVTPVLKRRIDERFRTGAENQAFLVEAVGAAETLKSMAVEPQMQRRWESQLAASVRAGFRAQNLNAVAGQIASGISKGQTVLIMFLGAEAVMEGRMTIGALVAFNMMAGRVAAPILRLAQLWQDFQQMRVSVERLGDILNTPTEIAGASRSALPAMQGRISFENVTFRYRVDRPRVLNGLSLDIAPGETIGLVGSSGSGKSTLTKLIQRLYLPETGRILVDGVDLALVDTAWLRRQTGVVLQENILFNRTVRENIALSDPTMPMERVIQAAQLAAAHDFILQMPEAYDTVIDERGGNLSGGQRQRIAIARALIDNPRVLLFDEATSALDYESESEIRRNMKAMCRGRTVIIIAHRLSAVRDCDRIVVLEKGAIVEQGSHEALLAKGGRYAWLWRCQSDEGTTGPTAGLLFEGHPDAVA